MRTVKVLSAILVVALALAFSTAQVGITRGGVSIIKSISGCTTSGTVLQGGSTPSCTAKVATTPTLSAATGDEYALSVSYTTNKATSGDDYGLRVNMTDTASPGTSYLFWFGVGGTGKIYGTNNGAFTATGYLTTQTGLSMQNGNKILTSSRGYIDSLGDGRWRFGNNADNAGVQLDWATADTLKIKSFTNSGYGTVDAGTYKASGTAGVTVTTCTQFTAGICTAGS